MAAKTLMARGARAPGHLWVIPPEELARAVDLLWADYCFARRGRPTAKHCYFLRKRGCLIPGNMIQYTRHKSLTKSKEGARW